MKHFAFVSTIDSVPWGGSEELWYRAALWLAGDGMNVRVNVKGWEPDPLPIRQLLSRGVEVCRRWGIPRRSRMRRLLNNDAYRWLDERHDDIVVISQGANFEGQAWAAACRKRAIPYALIAQAAGELWWLEDPAADAVRQAYESAAACFFVSHANLELTERQIGGAIPRARVIRNPFGVSFDAEPKWPSEDGRLRLACVGRLEAKFKGQDLIIEVLAMPKWRQRPVHVTLYGLGPNERTLRRQAAMREVRSVTFAGYCHDVEQIWADNHALLLTSRVEGLPLAVVEAMLCARPCIVTNVAGNAELLADNVTGFVAAAPTIAAVDEALERAWQRRSELRSIGEQAAIDVRKQVPRDPAEVFARLLTGQIHEDVTQADRSDISLALTIRSRPASPLLDAVAPV